MDNWVLRGANTLVKEKQQELPLGEGEVKVKVTYVLASNFDAVLYSGDSAARYPKTIGRFAVGRVTGPGMSRTGNGFTQSLPRRSLTTLSVSLTVSRDWMSSGDTHRKSSFSSLRTGSASLTRYANGYTFHRVLPSLT